MRCSKPLSWLLVLMGLAGCAREAPPSLPLSSQAAMVETPPVPQPMPPPPAPQAPAVPQMPAPGAAFFTQTGLASFYGRAHDGNATANGKRFDHRNFTAAHRDLPFGTLVRVTNLSNGRTVTVEITDRGPHIKSRVIDISLAAARALRMQKKGITRVRLEAFRIDQARAD